jgi:hypothetical protein
MKIIIIFGSFGLDPDQDSNPDLDQTPMQVQPIRSRIGNKSLGAGSETKVSEPDSKLKFHVRNTAW